MSATERALIVAGSNVVYVLLFYPIVFLLFRQLRKETLPAAGHFLGFFSTWIFVTVPGFLLGQGFYDWHPTVILITPTVAAVLGVAIAMSLFGVNQDQTPKDKVKERERPSDERHEELFALAWNEIENQNMKQGIWAKAFAQAGGDKERAKAIYLESRVKQLIEERASSAGDEGT